MKQEDSQNKKDCEIGTVITYGEEFRVYGYSALKFAKAQEATSREINIIAASSYIKEQFVLVNCSTEAYKFYINEYKLIPLEGFEDCAVGIIYANGEPYGVAYNKEMCVEKMASEHSGSSDNIDSSIDIARHIVDNVCIAYNKKQMPWIITPTIGNRQHVR